MDGRKAGGRTLSFGKTRANYIKISKVKSKTEPIRTLMQKDQERSGIVFGLLPKSKGRMQVGWKR